MSRLNTLYPNDEFLKNISNMFGKIDSKNETEIKQEIEQIGYKEFYRYSKEKDIYIKQLKSVLDEIREYVNRQEVNSIGSFFADTPIGKDLLQILDKVKE